MLKGAVLCAATALIVLAGSACDRNLEPFDPEESARPPDMGQIFPEGSQQGPGLRAPKPAAPLFASPRGNLPESPARAQEGVEGAAIRGRVSLDPQLEASQPGQGVLFVIARSGGAAAGPPLAVVRIPSPRFPVEFEMGQGNVMMPGARFEGPIRLKARLDLDGNAMTRTPGDLEGALSESVLPGERVEIVLDRRGAS